jgi:hypothetical protein
MPIVTKKDLPAGWSVLKHKPLRDAHLSKVLCGKIHDGIAVEYVTWIYNHDAGGCVLGHYFERLEPALADFDNRT